MSGFFSRLVGRRNPRTDAAHKPDERAMKILLDEAKKDNKLAAEALDSVAERQQRDAELVRQVITDILDRADRRTSKQAGRVIG